MSLSDRLDILEQRSNIGGPSNNVDWSPIDYITEALILQARRHIINGRTTATNRR